MKKLILSGGILTLLVAVLALMSLTTPKIKVHAPLKKAADSLTFEIKNTSSTGVSYTFKNAGGFGPTNVINAGTTQYFTIADDTYEVILNCSGYPTTFHMLFNTGEYYYSYGHTFYGIVVSSSHTTSLDLY